MDASLDIETRYILSVIHARDAKYVQDGTELDETRSKFGSQQLERDIAKETVAMIPELDRITTVATEKLNRQAAKIKLCAQSLKTIEHHLEDLRGLDTTSISLPQKKATALQLFRTIKEELAMILGVSPLVLEPSTALKF